MQRAELGDPAPVVGDVEVGVVLEPDVGFEACAAGGKGRVDGGGAPVVVVGVAGFWGDVVAEVWGEGKEGWPRGRGFAPGGGEVV